MKGKQIYFKYHELAVKSPEELATIISDGDMPKETRDMAVSAYESLGATLDTLGND